MGIWKPRFSRGSLAYKPVAEYGLYVFIPEVGHSHSPNSSSRGKQAWLLDMHQSPPSTRNHLSLLSVPLKSQWDQDRYCIMNLH